ncbi:MAG TPA: DUF1573 domain-containing protein [Membranihabitans sp.]|nr:DUF1573 domain-containing protein [Membranihabitans sp.]
MIYIRFGFLFLFLSTTLWLGAQPLKEIPLRFKLEAADSAYYKNDYYNALEWYNEVYREDRQNIYLNRLAELYFIVRDYKRAERWLSRLIERDKANEYPKARLYYAQALKMNGKYDLSAIQLQDIIKGSYSDSIRHVAQVEMKGITMAETLVRPANIAVNNVGTRVNTRNSEGSPIPIAGGDLYFISFGENKIIVPSDEEIQSQARIFNAKMNNKGEFTRKAAALDDIKVGQAGHIGNVFVAPDGRSLYFTYFLLDGNKLDKSEVYYSTSSGRGWSSPKRVEGLPTLGIVKNPSTGTLLGQKVLFFAYDGTGEGGFDLFYAPLVSDTQVGSVVPLGNGINTPGDEIAPIFSSNTLYFSTNGHPSVGGFDIYSALWTGETWTRIENMGKGINSTLDETFYFPSGDQINGYLVSNREGTRSVLSSTCCDDIFQLQDKTIIIRLLATVLEGEDPLNGASIAVFPVEQGEWGSPDIQYNEKGNDFTFAIDADKAYQVLVSKEGYTSDTVAFNTVGVVESKDFRGTFRLQKLPEEEEETIALNEPIRLNNIYYDFDDDKIKIEAEEDLDYLYNLLTEYPNMVIELSSHTDSRGSDSYNLDLSQRRANSARNYLEERGIASGRVEAVGYGETRILNHCTNGVNCSEEEHQLNRRTEFRIIEGPTTVPVRRETRKVRDRSQDDNNDQSALYPVIEFSQDEYDLGSVKKPAIKSGQIEFINTGNAPLEIEVASGCDCTTLDWPRGPVAPGSKGIIQVQYDSSKRDTGLQEVTVDILSNTREAVTSTIFKIMVE